MLTRRPQSQKDKDHLMTLDEEDYIPKKPVKKTSKPRRPSIKLERKTEERRHNKVTNKQIRNIDKNLNERPNNEHRNKQSQKKSVNVSPSSKIKLKALGYPLDGSRRVCFSADKTRITPMIVPNMQEYNAQKRRAQDAHYITKQIFAKNKQKETMSRTNHISASNQNTLLLILLSVVRFKKC